MHSLALIFLTLTAAPTQTPATAQEAIQQALVREARRDREWLLARAIAPNSYYQDAIQVKENLSQLSDREVRALAREIRYNEIRRIRQERYWGYSSYPSSSYYPSY